MIRCEFGVWSSNQCPNEATRVGFIAGCPYCGGGDCGSSAEHTYYCEEHADCSEGGDILIEDGDVTLARKKAEAQEYSNYAKEDPSDSYSASMIEHWTWATPDEL